MYLLEAVVIVRFIILNSAKAIIAKKQTAYIMVKKFLLNITCLSPFKYG